MQIVSVFITYLLEKKTFPSTHSLFDDFAALSGVFFIFILLFSRIKFSVNSKGDEERNAADKSLDIESLMKQYTWSGIILSQVSTARQLVASHNFCKSFVNLVWGNFFRVSKQPLEFFCIKHKRLKFSNSSCLWIKLRSLLNFQSLNSSKWIPNLIVTNRLAC